MPVPPAPPGPPGRPPGRCPSRPSGRPPPSGRRPGRCVPIPWAGANGLLPGRGVPGLRPTLPGVGPPGRGAGRAAPPGRGAGAGADDDGAAASAAGRSASGFAGRSVGAGAGAGAGAGGLGPGRAPGLGPAAGFGADEVTSPSSELTGAPGVARGPAGLAGSVFFSAAGLAVFAGALPEASSLGASALPPSDSRRRRTTGASSVEDGPRTYSPISLSFFRSSLLVIPISLAISWTRGLATTLLHGPDPRSGPVSLLTCSSLDSHRVVMSVSPLSGSSRRGSSAFSDAATARFSARPSVSLLPRGPLNPPGRELRQPERQRGGRLHRATKGPSQGIAPLRRCHARLPGMQVGTAPRQPRGRAVDHLVTDPDEPDEAVLVIRATTSDAGALGSHPTSLRGHCARPVSTRLGSAPVIAPAPVTSWMLATPAFGPDLPAIQRAKVDSAKFTTR